jgi:hypothetical protein
MRPSLKLRNVFNELAHSRLDGQKVLRISSLPLALESLGADLDSWEGRAALNLARSWATLGGDATIDIFEFAQAARELQTTKPPGSVSQPSSRATSQGERSWKHGSPLMAGMEERKKIIEVVEQEAVEAQQQQQQQAQSSPPPQQQRADSSSSPPPPKSPTQGSKADDAASESLLSARLSPSKAPVAPRSPIESALAPPTQPDQLVQSPVAPINSAGGEPAVQLKSPLTPPPTLTSPPTLMSPTASRASPLKGTLPT